VSVGRARFVRMQPTNIDVEVAAGVRLSVRAWPAEGAPVSVPYLLVHGLSSNARLWDGVAVRLAAAGHPSYAVDLRSHGESATLAEPTNVAESDAPGNGYDGTDGYDTATASRDLAAVCAGLDVTGVIAVGQSWGGNVVVRLAAEQPALVTALALVDGGWIDLSTEFPSWEECEAALRPPDVDGLRPEDVRSYITREHPAWSEEAVEATLANLRVRPSGHLERRLAIPKHMRIVRSMWDDPPWRDFPAIEVPVLLMPAIPGDDAAAALRRVKVGKAAAALSRATLREYVGGDHDLHAQQPAEIAEDLLRLARSL
jgi:pimeloyl-ACP methyl ester carboxylesterase